ncbi:MAG: S-layer protein [Candidatus Marsarchaeota archaeon]|nr:S-layer protein [Candidatus Marsarchaeota archaeon]
MKSLNAKKIAAVVGGAALLATGLAFAGPISFQNVPIISNSGQPLVQVVVGTLAKPSDGVAAANIAAAIGNLAFTSVNVTANVNTTQAAKVLHAVIPSSAHYSLTNQEVYFNESSTAYISGTYQFSALIGSVFNRGIVTKQYGATKTLQSTKTYAYPSTDLISPSGVSMASPYSAYGTVPFSESVSASTNGGGVSFSGFGGPTNSSMDNIIRVTSSDLPSLLSNSGSHLESEYLWLTGVPVFDQGSNGNINQFNLTNVGGAYEAVFADPIPFRSSSGGVNNQPITLFGQNWTIINYKLPGTTAFNSTSGATSATSTTAVAGGELSLASTLVPEETVYVGQNATAGPFTVQVADIGQPNNNGISPAALKVYYNGVLYNVSAVNPGVTQQFNDTGHNLYVHVYQTFAGLYAYEKYAKIQLYSNVVNVTSGHQFNSTYDKGWTTELMWTNSSNSGGTANEFQGIVVLNSTPTYLNPGQSFNFIGNPAMWKLTFEQPAFGSGTSNPVTLSTSEGSYTYENLASTSTYTPTNITEPGQILTVSAPSSLSNAFEVAGVPSSSVMYDLTPYEFKNIAAVPAGDNNITLTLSRPVNLVTSSSPLTVTVKGLSSSNTVVTLPAATFSSSSQTTATVAFPANTVTEITNITLSYPIPGATFTADAEVGSGTGTPVAELTPASPQIMYLKSGQVNYYLTSGSSINFNQNNGETQTFTLNELTTPKQIGSTGPYEFYNYSMNEFPVPFNTSVQDNFTVGIANATNSNPASSFDLNYTGALSSGSVDHGNVTYTTNTQGTKVVFAARQGFYSERGSEVASISPGSVTINFAKGVDMLNFVVSPVNVTAVTKHFRIVGPVGIGQPIPNVPNVTVANVTANISVSNINGATVAGISNLTATATPAVAIEPVLLKNLTTSPLVVLNSTANPSSSLILIGSGYVNGLSAQVQASNNITFTPTSAPVLQAFGTKRILIAGYYANQTTAMANKFIQDLYAAASTS